MQSWLHQEILRCGDCPILVTGQRLAEAEMMRTSQCFVSAVDIIRKLSYNLRLEAGLASACP